MSNKKKTNPIQDERREQILTAAAKIFARRGMVATKMSDIAKEAKLSYGLVYHYFKSKEDIFTVLVQKASAYSMKTIHLAHEQEGTPLDQLHWMTEQIIQNLAEGEDVLLFLIMIQASTSDAIPEEVKELLTNKERSPVAGTIPIIVAGQKAGLIVQGDPVQLAITYYAFVQGLAINKVQWQECPMPDANTVMKIFQ